MNWPCYIIEDRNQRIEARAASVGAYDDEVGGFRVFDLVRVDTGEVLAEATYGLFLGDAPGQVATPGALWKVRHRPDNDHAPMSAREYGTEDHWLILTPAGVICSGCPATGGGNWTVTGEAPNLTVTPSLHLSPGAGPPYEWHGFCTNGELVGA